MLAAKDIRLVEETARALHAQGQAERARAVEAVLAAAKSTLETHDGLDLPEYLTTGEVARSLALRHQTVLKWVTAGDLPTIDLGGQQLVRRDTLFAFLDGLRRRSALVRLGGPNETETARRQREWVLAGLPEKQRDRLEELHDKLEAGRRLTRAERDEMTTLQHQLATVAAERLEEWIRRLAAATN